MTITAKFIDADQDWSTAQTTYWFEISGEYYGTGETYDAAVFGVVEGGDLVEPLLLDSDGCPITPGDFDAIMLRNSVTITDEIRSRASR